MNRIYQVIWSEARHMYVVVSEIARRHSKNTTSVNTSGARQTLLTSIKKGGRSAAAALAVIAMIGFVSWGGTVYAEDTTSTKVNIGNGGTIEYTKQGDVVAGKDNQMPDDQSGQNNVVTGTGNTAQHIDNEGNAQVLGTSGMMLIDKATGQEIAKDAATKGLKGSVVSGDGAIAEADGDTSIGKGANITNPLTTFYVDEEGKATKSADDAAYYVDQKTNKPTTVPQVYRTGYDDKTGGASDTSTTTSDPQYVHTLTQTIVHYDKDGNQVGDPEMVTVHEVNGSGDKVTGRTPETSEAAEDGSYTVTTTADETGDPSLNYLKSDQPLYSQQLYDASTDSVAIGTNATVKGKDAVAEGHDAKASGNSVAVGHKASSGESATSVGPGATAKQNGVAVGVASQSEINGVAAGNNAQAGDQGVASGYHAVANAQGQAIGSNAYAAPNSTAIGNSAKANVEGSVALGDSSAANRTSGSPGWDPKTQTLAVETDHDTNDPVWYSNRAAVSVGQSDGDGNPIQTRQITNVAAGTNDSDAVNVAQLKRVVARVEPHYYSWNDKDVHKSNYNNNGATGTDSLAAGIGVSASGAGSVAIGTHAVDSEGNPDIIEYETETVDNGNGGTTTQIKTDANGNRIPKYRTEATGKNAVAVGVNDQADGESSVAIGYKNSAASKESVSMGAKNTIAINSYNSTALGNKNTVKELKLRR